MKKIIKITLAFFGLLIMLELLAIPTLIILNSKIPEISLKKSILYDVLLIILTYMIGFIIYQLTKEKNEYKNR